MPNSAVITFCNFVENSGKLDFSLIAKIMQEVWPRGNQLTKHEAFNIWFNIMRLLPIFRQSNDDFERFKGVDSASAFLNGIENEVNLDNNEAEVAQFVWLEAAVSTSG